MTKEVFKTIDDKKIRDMTIMSLHKELGLTPSEIAKRLVLNPKCVAHIIRKNRTAEENAQAILDHRKKVHFNFGRCKR